MRRTEDERLLEALDFIDEVYVGELEKYYLKDNAAKRKTFVKATRWIAAGAALAACVLLVTLAIPKTKSVIQHFDRLIVFSPGNSDSFTKAYKGSVHAPKWLRELGLDCYEYPCGTGIHVGEETARKVGENAAIEISSPTPPKPTIIPPNTEATQNTKKSFFVIFSNLIIMQLF